MDEHNTEGTAEDIYILTDLFKHDTRATIILETFKSGRQPSLLYQNKTFRDCFKQINKDAYGHEEAKKNEFLHLIRLAMTNKTTEIMFGGELWVATRLRQRWCVVYLNLRRNDCQLSESPFQGSKSIATQAAVATEPYRAGRNASPTNIPKAKSDVAASSVGAKEGRKIVPSSGINYRALAESAPVGYAVFALDGQPSYMNQAYLELSGLTSQDIESGQWINAIIPEDRQAMEQKWARLITGQTVKPSELRVNSPWNGNSRRQRLPNKWLLSHAFPELDAKGNLVWILGWLTDISYQKWCQQMEASRLNESLERRPQNEEFIEMIFHELRNPLSAILQSADEIASLTDSRIQGESSAHEAKLPSLDEISDTARTITLCAEHQKRIIDDFLTLTELDVDLVQLAPEKIKPVDLLVTVLKMFDSEAKAADIQLHKHFHPSYEELAVDIVLLDPSRVLQVLINLMKNAIKFTRKQLKRQITVSLSTTNRRPSSTSNNVAFLPQVHDWDRESANYHEDDLYLQFSVKDTGSGMNDMELKRLFDRSCQASTRSHREYGGSSLGLHISRRLTELQDGQICAASELGKVTTFAFYIKARRCPNEPEDPQSTSCKSPANFQSKKARAMTMIGDAKALSAEGRIFQTESSPEVSLVKISQAAREAAAKLSIHCLVVEDNMVNQKVLAKQLRGMGCKVSVANHGIEALAFLEWSTFATCPASLPPPTIDHAAEAAPYSISILLMDLEMPVMDGLTCIRKIRQMQDDGRLRGHVPVMAITANARKEQISAAMKQGMDHVITKPFRASDLLPQMRAFVEKFAIPETEEVDMKM